MDRQDLPNRDVEQMLAGWKPRPLSPLLLSRVETAMAQETRPARRIAWVGAAAVATIAAIGTCWWLVGPMRSSTSPRIEAVSTEPQRPTKRHTDAVLATTGTDESVGVDALTQELDELLDGRTLTTWPRDMDLDIDDIWAGMEG